MRAEDSKPDEQIRMQRANYEYRADKIGNERASVQSGQRPKGKPRAAAETYVSTGRRGRDCSPNRFDVYPGLSRARSVIQKLKYRLINGGSSFANFFEGPKCASRRASSSLFHDYTVREAY